MEIDGNGVVFSGYSVSGGNIDITGSNVTVRDVRVSLAYDTWAIALRHTNGVTIEDSELSSPDGGSGRLLVGIKDIYADSSGLQILRTDISHAATGIQVESGLIQDNYIHDMGYKSGDHTNGTTSNGGTDMLKLVHNTVFNSQTQTDAISLFQDFGPQANRIISDNLLAGGGYTLYGGANPGKESTATNITITNNRIARIYYPSGGYYGPVTAYTRTGGNVWAGNVWDDTGKTIDS